MKYGVVGVGAIGGYYGSKLAYSGQEVHFLLHSDYQFVKECGIHLFCEDGAWSCEPSMLWQHQPRQLLLQE